MQRALINKAVISILLALVALLFLYFGVMRFQRELFLVALDDLTFYDGRNWNRIVFTLPSGEEEQIIRCEDRKSKIEPVIRIKEEETVYLRGGDFKIIARPTGLLSSPRYLGCPGY
jgi:hypothetical protein